MTDNQTMAFLIQLSQQNRIIYQYLASGRTLSQMIALNNLGIGSLTKRISELRQALAEAGDAQRIESVWKVDFSKQRYKSYQLIQVPPGGWPKEAAQ
jgi:hypothetical protein